MVLPPIGAKVEIKKGRYSGIAAWVVAHVDNQVAVKRDGWMITREYSPAEVEVLSDANG